MSLHVASPTQPDVQEGSSAPYVVPFAVFLGLMLASPYLMLPPQVEYPLRVAIMAAVVWFFSRGVLDFRVRRPFATVALGIAVFVLWIGPDMLWPGYRNHWLFQNSITGGTTSTIPTEARNDMIVLLFRTLRAVIIVAIVEELFWRGWLMRWLISSRFSQIPLGTYTHSSFWIAAALFASEHGPYWDVGFAAGAIYNWWMVQTRSLGDLILAHALTNLCLCAFVIATGRWEYWL